MKLAEILSWLRSLAPEESAVEGDPVGALIQPPLRDITRIVVSLDATPAIAAAAAEANAELIICHHPLIYHPLARLDESDPIGRSVLTCAREGITLYAMHTNWDRAEGGINDTLAQKIGMQQIRSLGTTGDAQIPRIGVIAPCPLHALASHIDSVLDTTAESALRYSHQFSGRIVQTLAVCGGAGASFLQQAIAAGADALLTADVRHHEFVDATGRGAILIDAGHGATERPGMAALANRLRRQFPDLSVTYLDQV